MNNTSNERPNSPTHIYSIQIIEGMGRGIFAERDVKQGETITKCEILVLSPNDTTKVNETNLKCYTFVYDGKTKQDCLVLGDGEIFNHSDDANVLYDLIEWNGRKMMRFQASHHRINPSIMNALSLRASQPRQCQSARN
jgi:hypothetical protein